MPRAHSYIALLGLLCILSAPYAMAKEDSYVHACRMKGNSAHLGPHDILFAIQRDGSGRIQPIAILKDAKLLPVSNTEDGAGQEIKDVSALYDLRTNDKHAMHANVDFDAAATGCYWFGEFEHHAASVEKRKKASKFSANHELPTILATQSMDMRFQGKQKEIVDFYNALPPDACVYSGDVPEKQTAPCEMPKIYAFNDFNHNGRVEYWYSIPYLWDTGFGVTEIVDGKIVPISEICPGCSD